MAQKPVQHGAGQGTGLSNGCRHFRPSGFGASNNGCSPNRLEGNALLTIMAMLDAAE
jgi:hypothetical protein